MDILRYFTIPYTGGKGVCQIADLALSDEQTAALNRVCPKAHSAVVVLFPYLVRDTGNLSLYARGRDYHTVILQALEPVCETLRRDFPQYHFIAKTDASPLPEVRAAWLSGAGILGKNGLIFDRVYGSFVFIGTVLTDAPCPPTLASPACCPDCGACRRACPAQALACTGQADSESCLSGLTQDKSDLSDLQRRRLTAHPLVWGCDTCSLVCPLNREVPETSNPAFRNSRICSVELEDIDGLTRRQFLQKYPDRAFTWRGPKPLVRNLRLK